VSVRNHTGAPPPLTGALRIHCLSMDKNQLYYGDNLDVLRKYTKDESVDLIYLDPPFNSNRNYSVIFNKNGQVNDANQAQIEAFEDTWHWTPTTDVQFGQFIESAPNQAADAITAFHTLLGENDAMAYLVNMAPRLLELHSPLPARRKKSVR
jgi:adenine specific DNA methylase Mod